MCKSGWVNRVAVVEVGCGEEVLYSIFILMCTREVLRKIIYTLSSVKFGPVVLVTHTFFYLILSGAEMWNCVSNFIYICLVINLPNLENFKNSDVDLNVAES